MSVHSDDTDFLLLIPPDFFLVPSDSEEDITLSHKVSERLLVSDLLSQVNELEGRLCMIEHRCVDESMSSNCNLRYLRQYGSADTLNIQHKCYQNSRSLQATPLKSSVCSWKKSETSSNASGNHFGYEPRASILTSSQYLNQKERDNQVLKEIDTFFKHKEKRMSDVSRDSSEEGEGKEEGLRKLTVPEISGLTTATLNLSRVNDLLKQLEQTQQEMERKLKTKDLTEIESEDVKELLEKKDEERKENGCCNNQGSKLKNSRRVLEFASPQKNVAPTCEDSFREKIFPAITNSQFHCGGEDSSNTCMNKTEKVENKSEGGNQANPSNPTGKDVANLLSLSNLWGSTTNVNKPTQYEEQQILKQRLQEERCRRQHCEEKIQQLQIRLCEEQQKVAVAVRVDQEKDKAIFQLTEGWNKLIGHWQDLESQRNNLAKKLLKERDKFKEEITGSCQTVKRYELELSKALDLAHGYKEKCEAADKDRKLSKGNLVREVEVLKKELQSTSDKLQLEEEKNMKLGELLKAREEAVNLTKAKVSDLQSQVRELKKVLKDGESELEVLKQDKEKLCEKLKEEKTRLGSMEQGKKSLQLQQEDMKKREKMLKDEVKSVTEQLERTKVELKEFYQEQVEKIVQEKLKEFQEQLSAAEKTLQKEIEAREKSVTEMAMKQVQQIVEKHVLEVSIIEDKHKEELELWKVKVAQLEDRMSNLRRKLELQSCHKNEIAQKLHCVMETQWQEALRIITDTTTSPQRTPKEPPPNTHPSSPLRENTFTLHPSSSTSPTTTTDTPFCKDGQVTYRDGALTYRVNETPQKIAPVSQDDLRNYIQALLERAPGCPTGHAADKTLESCVDTTQSSITQWQHILSDASSQFVNPGKTEKAGNPKKPWK